MHQDQILVPLNFPAFRDIKGKAFFVLASAGVIAEVYIENFRHGLSWELAHNPANNLLNKPIVCHRFCKYYCAKAVNRYAFCKDLPAACDACFSSAVDLVFDEFSVLGFASK